MGKNRINLHDALLRYINQTLMPLGWLESYKQGLPVDLRKNPLPWWTYPAIEFITTLIKPYFRVFEYGGGYSTIWWSKCVDRVTAIDHDKDWIRKVSPELTSPHEILHVPPCASYTTEAKQIANSYFGSSPKKDFPYDPEKITRRGLNDGDFIAYAETINKFDEVFDCIVIDGMARRLCVYYAVPKLKEAGIIIFDNSNRSDYMEGYQYLVAAGFYQLRLWGSVPGSTFPSCTSIFTRKLESLPKIVFEGSMFDIPEY